MSKKGNDGSVALVLTVHVWERENGKAMKIELKPRASAQAMASLRSRVSTEELNALCTGKYALVCNGETVLVRVDAGEDVEASGTMAASLFREPLIALWMDLLETILSEPSEEALETLVSGVLACGLAALYEEDRLSLVTSDFFRPIARAFPGGMTAARVDAEQDDSAFSIASFDEGDSGARESFVLTHDGSVLHAHIGLVNEASPFCAYSLQRVSRRLKRMAMRVEREEIRKLYATMREEQARRSEAMSLLLERFGRLVAHDQLCVEPGIRIPSAHWGPARVIEE